jgi:hypothetical protein
VPSAHVEVEHAMDLLASGYLVKSRVTDAKSVLDLRSEHRGRLAYIFGFSEKGAA